METVTMKAVVYNGSPSSAVLIDLRKPAEYAKGHIPGAINIPYEQLKLNKVRFNKSDELAFYCSHGSKSMAACTLYERYGYKTWDLLGGFEQYKREMRKKVFDGRR